MKEYKLSEEEYIRNYILLEKQVQTSLFFRIILFLLIVGGMGFLWAIGQYIASLIIAVIVIIFGYFWINGAKWTAIKNYRIDPSLSNMIKVSITEDGIHSITVRGEKMLNSSGLSRISETDEMFYIQHESGVILYIPKRVLDIDDIKQVKQFAYTIRNKLHH